MAGYVVTVTRRDELGIRRWTGRPDEPVVVSRQEVDTLDEARHAADEAVVAGYGRDRMEDREVPTGYYDASWTARTLPAGGGTIGLPDGSSITVKPAEDGAK